MRIITISVWPKIDLNSWVWPAVVGLLSLAVISLYPCGYCWEWHCPCVAESWRRPRWRRLRPRSERCSPTEWPQDRQHRTDHPGSSGRRWTAPWVSPYTDHGVWRNCRDGHSFSAGLKPKELKEAFNSWFLVLWSVSPVLQRLLLGFYMYSMADSVLTIWVNGLGYSPVCRGSWMLFHKPFGYTVRCYIVPGLTTIVVCCFVVLQHCNKKQYP